MCLCSCDVLVRCCGHPKMSASASLYYFVKKKKSNCIPQITSKHDCHQKKQNSLRLSNIEKGCSSDSWLSGSASQRFPQHMNALQHKCQPRTQSRLQQAFSTKCEKACKNTGTARGFTKRYKRCSGKNSDCNHSITATHPRLC